MRIRLLPPLLFVLSLHATLCAEEKLPPMKEITVKSSIDGSDQPSLLWVPETAEKQPTPLLIWLHSWSANYHQEMSLDYEKQAVERGWILLLPNFRGPNKRPEACGSELARTDIIDALDYVRENYKVDPKRIYLAGASGGGHMTLLMAGYYPERFSAVSAWVGITDLEAWYDFHAPGGQAKSYALDILKVMGGPPGESEAIDKQYRARSPLYFLDKVGDLRVDIAAGVKDGHTGSVPIAHSLNAFNRIAATNGDPGVSQEEAEQLWTDQKLASPQPSDMVTDESYGRDIILRRHSGKARVTIFQGGHEGLPEACCAWLAKQTREAKP